MNGDHDEIQALKARLAALEGQPGEGQSSTGTQAIPVARKGPSGCMIALIIVALLGVGLWILSTIGEEQMAQDSQRASEKSAAAITGIRAKITPGPLGRSEQREAERLLARAYPGSEARFSHVGFYYEGRPTMCGTIGTIRVGTDRRFMVKNGSVLLEGDVARGDFDLFWQICDLAGA